MLYEVITHGVDVSPDGKYIVVGGKLDTQASVYSFENVITSYSIHYTKLYEARRWNR